jgi:hypothetical protein
LAEARAGAGAGGAALFAVEAVVGTQLFFDMEGLVLAFFVFVTNDVVRAGDDTTSASGAQTCGNDLFVEFFPSRVCGLSCFSF